MKMVILGGSAPKCDQKPANPTSSSQVGTMVGKAAGDNKQGARGSTANNPHRTTYQGLLQAPRIPGIFDHQLIKTSYEDVNSSNKQGQKQGGSQSPKEAQKGSASVSGVNQIGEGYGLLQGVVGKPKTSQPQQHRYHYQKFNSQSATNFGGIGGQRNTTRPGQKSIKQQRDLAQLRFYQTLTNQPHLITQAQTQGNKTGNAGGQVTPNQVKMLSNMRMSQHPGSGMDVSSTYGGIYPRNKSQNIKVPDNLKRQDYKSGQGTLRQSQISGGFDGQAVKNLQDQLRAQTTQGNNKMPRRQIGTAPTNGLIDVQGERALSGLTPGGDKPFDSQLKGKNDSAKDDSAEIIDIPSPHPNRVVTAEEAGGQNQIETATSQPNMQDYVQVKDDPYDQRRGSGTTARIDETRKLPSSGQRSSHGIMKALHGPVPAGGRLSLREANQQKSNATMQQNESQRASQDTGFLGRQGMTGNNGNSQSPYRSNLSGLKSEVKRVKASKSKNSMGIHVSKIEKKHQFGIQTGFSAGGVVDEDYQKQMERFSSQGQEELVQAYQLPTVYASNESKSGFLGYKSQHIDKRRNYTSYGGQRSSAAAGIAARNYEYMRQSAASTYHNSGGAAPRSMMGGPQGPKDQMGKNPSTAYSGPRGDNQQSKGALSNLMVKTCSFQPRDLFTQRREQIKNDYSLPPKSANAAAQKSGLPKIGQRGQIAQAKALSQTRPSAITQMRSETTNLNTAAPQSTAVEKVMNPTLHPASIEQTKRDEVKPLAQTQIIPESKTSQDRSQSNQRHHCERFMRRGNKPVPANYEERDEPEGSKALMPYINSDDPMKKRMISESDAAAAKINSSHSGRQMVYGNIKLGNFDEEISGINLSKLFSVYGPQSAEGYKRKKVKPESQGTGIGGPVLKSTEFDNQTGLQIQGDDYRGTTKLLKDGGSNDPSIIEKRNQIPTVDQQYISSGPSKADQMGSEQDNQGWFQRKNDKQRYLGESPTDLDDDDSSMEDSDEDEEPLIIQLMESMFSRKKTVFETEQLISEISVEEIRQEFRRLAMREKCRITDLERAKVFEQRMNECEKLNKLIQLENEEVGTSLFDGPDKSARENPFYQALKAQKEERERYKQMLQLAIAGPQEIVTPHEQTYEDPKSLAIESEQPREDDGNDIFKHTFVDILDEQKEKNKHTKNLYHEQKEQELTVQREQKEIFYFNNFSFDLPTEYYKQLGDFNVIKRHQAQKIREFMASTWPVLRGKKVQYKIAYDQNKDVFNVVLLGKDCPLSKCCKMTVYFQFTRDIGGKVICMENLCALNPLDHFQIDLGLVQALFYDQQLEPQNTETSQIQQEVMRQMASREALTKKQYKKLKPTFKKVISQEISKMISKGHHMNMSIRDYISQQDLEEKVQHHVTKGKAGMIGRPKPAPPKLTQQNLMKLLYDTSSIQSTSQNSQLASDSQQQFMLDSAKQPIASLQWNNQNQDLGFAFNPQMYDQMIGMPENYAHNQQILPFTGLNEPQMYQMNADQVDEMILNSQQNAVLFSHTALEDASPENPNLQLTDSREMNMDNLESSLPQENTQGWAETSNAQNEVQAQQPPVEMVHTQQKTTGTFNPAPQLTMKSNLTHKESNKENMSSLTPKVLISGQSDPNVIPPQQLETNPDQPVIEEEK